MLTFKKKSLKVLWVFCLVGITLALLSMNIFADEYVVPDTALKFTLTARSDWYKIYGLTDWVSGNRVDGVDSNTRVYFNHTFYKDNEIQQVCQKDYTYYITFWINNVNGNYFDAFNFYLTNNTIYENSTSSLSIRTLDNFFINVTYGNPMSINLIFRCNKDIDYSVLNRLVFTHIGIGQTSYIASAQNCTAYYDINATVFNSLVMNQLENIDNQLNTTNEELSDVNNNLVSIDTNIDNLNDTNTQLLNGVQRKIDEQSAQQHQDAEDINDSIQNLPEQQYEYEHNREQTELNQLLDSFDENSELAPLYDYLDPDNINDAMGNIWTSLSHNNKVYDIIFPSSGNVPLIDATLWDSQVIHLSDFTETVPGRLLIAACNGVFALSFIVGIIVFINRAISDTFKT